MATSFDPYHRWLGIAAEERPADHYRLLGLRQFEGDADVIESAADKQMAHVRTFQSGRYAEDAQRVLNEISAARLVLLNAEKKKIYDATLGTKIERSRQPRVQERPLPITQPMVITRPRNKQSAMLKWAVFGALAGVMVLLLVGGAIALSLQRSKSTGPTAQTGESNQTTFVTQVDPAKLDNTTNDNVTPSNPVEGQANTATTPATTRGDTVKRPATATDDSFVTSRVPKESPEDETADPRPTELAVGPPPPAALQKTPVPDKAARDAARKKIAEILPIDDADTPVEKAQLAAQVMDIARDTKDDPTARFVLLNLAREQAAAAAKARLAFQAIDLLEAEYDFDIAPVRLATLGEAVRATLPPTEKREVVVVGIEMMDAMMRRDEYHAADQLVDPLLDLARRAKDRPLADAVTARRRRARELAVAYEQAKSAIAMLNSDPNNASANLSAGRYHSIAKGDWSTALPMLAKGSDGQLSAAAKAELQRPANAEQQEKLAATWWTIAEAETESAAQQAFQSRALAWYQRAAGELTGLAKVQAERRIEQLADAGIRPASLVADVEVLSRPPTGLETVPVDEPQSAPQVVDGLVAHWTFDEGRGTVARDTAGGHHGTIKGATWTDGVHGKALRFDGRSSRVDLGEHDTLNFGGAMTMAAWVRPARLPQGITFMNILAHAHPSQSREIYLRMNSGNYSVGCYTGRHVPTERRAPDGDVGQWVHLAGVYDGDSWYVYRNGEVLVNRKTDAGPLAFDGAWAIGAHPNKNERHFEGDIDEVRIYNRALSADEVKALSQAELPAE